MQSYNPSCTWKHKKHHRGNTNFVIEHITWTEHLAWAFVMEFGNHSSSWCGKKQQQRIYCSSYQLSDWQMWKPQCINASSSWRSVRVGHGHLPHAYGYHRLGPRGTEWRGNEDLHKQLPTAACQVSKFQGHSLDLWRSLCCDSQPGQSPPAGLT